MRKLGDRAWIRGGWAALAVLVLLPGIVRAQDSDRRQEQLAELQEVRRELAEIRARAMEDPAIQKESEKLQELIAQETRKIDPEADAKRERLAELQKEMRAAQEAGDQAKASQIWEEAERLQASLQQAQAEVMASRKVARSAERLQEMIVKRMQELDRRTPRLLDREAELTAKLQGGN